MHELRDADEPTLPELLARLSPVDFVLVEGFKFGPHPKIEVHRTANAKPYLHPNDPSIVAVATDSTAPVSMPQVALDDIDAIVALVTRHAEVF